MHHAPYTRCILINSWTTVLANQNMKTKNARVIFSYFYLSLLCECVAEDGWFGGTTFSCHVLPVTVRGQLSSLPSFLPLLVYGLQYELWASQAWPGLETCTTMLGLIALVMHKQNSLCHTDSTAPLCLCFWLLEVLEVCELTLSSQPQSTWLKRKETQVETCPFLIIIRRIREDTTITLKLVTN